MHTVPAGAIPANPLRRMLLMGGLAVPFLASGAACAISNDKRTRSASLAAWDAAMAQHDRARAASDAAEIHYANLPDVEQTDAAYELVDALGETHCEALDALIAMPAPNVQALCWKIEYLLEAQSTSSTPSWSREYIQPLIDDVRRLAREEKRA